MVNDQNEDKSEHEPMPEGAEPPPRGVKTMAFVRWAIVGAAALLAVFVWIALAKDRLSVGPARPGLTAPKYQCPMHPQIVSDEPGSCPICHMALEPISATRGGGSRPPPDDAGAAAMGSDAGAGAPGSRPPGTAAIDLALDRVQAIGVRTAVAEEREGARTLRVTAVVTSPEQGAAEVHTRSAGFVEAIQVDQTGLSVRTGQPMLALYSPEILQAQNELLATRGWAGDGGAIAASARRKLELLGMSAGELDRVVTSGTPLRAITIASPRGGFVTKKNVVLGSYVTPETVLYELQDLSKVYVVADVFLPDASDVKVGEEARFVPARDARRAVTAKVDLVYPVVSLEARTRRIRMQLRNEGGSTYSPGEYGTVELAAAPGRRLAIPRDALVDTGTATYVFVVVGEGHFVPRVVSVAGSSTEHVFVNAGLASGERVVSGATFLIDAESRLQASIAEADPATKGGPSPWR